MTDCSVIRYAEINKGDRGLKMSPKIVDKEEKRKKIVAAALKVFASKGYKGTRTIDIAEAARIGKGTIYEYFRSKEELIEAIFERLFLDYELRLEELAESYLTPVEAILASFEQMMADADEYADLVPVYFELWTAKDLNEKLGFDRQMSEWFEKFGSAYQDLIVKGQKRGEINPEIDAEALGRTLVSAIDGIILHYCLFQPPKSFFKRQQKELERMVRNVLDLGKKEG
ncbi:MAG: TetR/AcrR family transcriptional regulator [Prochloraceae cyanobacterium]